MLSGISRRCAGGFADLSAQSVMPELRWAAACTKPDARGDPVTDEAETASRRLYSTGAAGNLMPIPDPTKLTTTCKLRTWPRPVRSKDATLHTRRADGAPPTGWPGSATAIHFTGGRPPFIAGNRMLIRRGVPMCVGRGPRVSAAPADMVSFTTTVEKSTRTAGPINTSSDRYLPTDACVIGATTHRAATRRTCSSERTPRTRPTRWRRADTSHLAVKLFAAPSSPKKASGKFASGSRPETAAHHSRLNSEFQRGRSASLSSARDGRTSCRWTESW